MNGRPLIRTAMLIALGGIPAAYSGHRAEAQSDRSVRMVEIEDIGARYWPRWRGASGQGLAADSGYPDAWSNEENVLWRTPVPGRGP